MGGIGCCETIDGGAGTADRGATTGGCGWTGRVRIGCGPGAPDRGAITGGCAGEGACDGIGGREAAAG
jgi:hypothetical protein